jgi:hypothetical protein
MLKSLDSVSNFIRAMLSLVLVGGVGAGAWFGYNTYYQKDLALREQQELVKKSEAEIARLNEDLAAKQREIARLATANRLLKVDRRLAQIEVLQQQEAVPGDPATLTTTFSFVEIDDEGRPLAQPQVHTVKGDIVYVEAWIVKFDDELVEQGDLFRRLWGEFQEPNDGFKIETVGSRPAAYSRGDEPSDVEREIWENFWEYATDPERAKASGVRVAHVEAAANKLVPGKRYRITLRASDGLSITPENVPTTDGGGG